MDLAGSASAGYRRELSGQEQGMRKADKLLHSIIEIVEQDESLHHLLPILFEAKEAFARGPAFSKDDVSRVAELIRGLHGDDALFEKALAYADEAGPNMFAHTLAAELERLKKSAS
ncbi:hypothetical protein [Mesorhizobium retamae]|uniref:Uncharacterized protein n=1 Tax=Mesorhizobium retamae TaxID=2912854 RepID=A0ABS9QPE8_9HYPH|nr:hypothetical protein [Mesorhizobium sp. IRAMC:0171]MCG7509318.1 hypothetical protein [Mesorhizobium sp. IRAMC:0171]